MKNRIWVAAVVLLALSTTAAFTVLALQQTPSQQTEQSQTPSDQAQQEATIVPFREILAQKLGVDVETLEQAFADSRTEFEAQFANGESPRARMLDRFRSNPGQNFRMRDHGSDATPDMHDGGHWMKKTTIMHEFYQMGK